MKDKKLRRILYILKDNFFNFVLRYINYMTQDHTCLIQIVKTITGHEISKQKHIEDYLYYIRDYYENIIGMLPGHVYWFDKNNIFLGCNDEHAKNVGLSSRKEIIGKTNDDMPWKESASYLNRINQQVIATEEAVEAEESGAIYNGRYITMLTRKAPLRDNAGKIVGVLGVSLDISQRKKMEEELIKAKENAEKANQLKTEFIRNMEHDIRTPFSGILSISAILAKQEKRADKKELLDMIVTSAQALLNYCNNILDFSKIEHGLPVLEQKLDLYALIKDLKRLEYPAIKSKKITLNIRIEQNMPKIIMSDPPRLYRILINLMSNAIKFTDKGYINVIVTNLKQIKNEMILQFTIEDTGIGIPQEQQQYIYEKFTRLSPSNKGKYAGSGLGLSIVKQFVNDLHGEIDVESQVGKGSRFICTIPVKLPLLVKKTG